MVSGGYAAIAAILGITVNVIIIVSASRKLRRYINIPNPRVSSLEGDVRVIKKQITALYQSQYRLLESMCNEHSTFNEKAIQRMLSEDFDDIHHSD